MTTDLVYRALAVARRDPKPVHLRLPRLGAVERPLPNGRRLRLWSDMDDDGIANRVFWYGWTGWEPETSSVLYRLAERSQVMVDVGAYVGLDTLLMALANPAARVLAFEPNPRAYERLQLHLRQNQVANVETFQMALGDERERADLVAAHAGMPSIASLSPDAVERLVGAGERQTISVAVETLDAVLEERDAAEVDLLKIDTEGGEPGVLRGMRRTLARSQPVIVCEVLEQLGTAPEIEALLCPLGYRFYRLRAAGLERRDQIQGHRREPNYLCVTPDRARACEEALGTALV